MKNQRGFGAIGTILVLVVAGLVSFGSWYIWHSKNKTNSMYNSVSNHGQKVCPEAWYDNHMPGAVGKNNSVPREYFVVGGKRVELTQLDVVWVKHNCPVNKPQIVE